MIKAAFFDIDGTLLSFRTHQVSQGTIAAFDALQQQGILTFISTGRPKILIPQLPVSFDGYVTMNGGYVYLPDQVLLRQPIPQQDTLRWLDYVEQNNLCTMGFLEHEMCLNRIDPVAMAIRDQLEFEMPSLAPIETLREREVFQFIALMPPDKDAEVQALLPHCRLPRWHPAFSDVINATNNKAAGMECLLNHFGLRQEECMAFGDGGNDVEMLEYAHIGVSMGNANENVKQHADYVTTSVDDEGILTALKELHII